MDLEDLLTKQTRRNKMNKLKQMWVVCKKVSLDVYYGIKWVLFYSEKRAQKLYEKQYFKQIIDIINKYPKYDSEKNMGVQKRGYLEVDESQIPIIIFNEKEKKSNFKSRIGVEFDDVIKKAETDLKIKFTKKQKETIWKVTDPYNFNNTTRVKIIEIFEAKQKRSKKAKKSTKRGKK